MEEKRNEEVVEPEGIEEEPKGAAEDAHLDRIYSNVASNGYENLRTSYIENKAKELRKRKK